MSAASFASLAWWTHGNGQSLHTRISDAELSCDLFIIGLKSSKNEGSYQGGRKLDNYDEAFGLDR